MRVSVDACPSAAELELLFSEELAGSERDVVEMHVESCTSCQKELERLVPSTIHTPAPSLTVHAPDSEAEAGFLSRLKHLPVPRPAVSEYMSGAEPTSGPKIVERFDGRRLGQYEVIERIGTGSMGVVYKALHIELGKVVALKVLPATMMDDVSVARFKNEARSAGRLDHPNIVTIHDAGQFEGVHFLVMALVDGTDLARLVQQRGRLAVTDACEAVRQAALGLQHAFERGIVHRDIKPSNLMLARDGLVKVLDLGIARSFAETPAVERLTATGMLLGTADYLAPEQWDNPNAVDTRADVYSLGCTLYHLLAGHPPFGPEYHTILTKMRAHLEAPVPPIAEGCPDIPAELVTVLEKMLAKNRDERFSSPGEVVEALRPFCAGANLAALADLDSASASAAAAVAPTASAADTVQPSRPFGANRVDASRRVGSRKRIGRSVSLLVAAATFGGALAALLFFWPKSDGPKVPSPPLKISEVHVNHYRGQEATLLGDLAKSTVMSTEAVRPDDSVRFSATLNTPAYCYLIAFNPDGTEQLCYPEDTDLSAVKYPENKSAKSMSMVPTKSEDMRYPSDQFFEPGVAGLQAFVLIVSAEPLPSYAKWRQGLGTIPWQKVDRDVGPWRWEFDGQDIARIQGPRGDRVERGSAPREFRELCNYFRGRPEAQMVWAIAFPVVKK